MKLGGGRDRVVANQRESVKGFVRASAPDRRYLTPTETLPSWLPTPELFRGAFDFVDDRGLIRISFTIRRMMEFTRLDPNSDA